jgi:beta-lactam-binding protein with PASTA domain
VLLVRPTAGTELEVGGTVTIVPSRGPPPVQVPPVEGKPLEEARRLLERAGLEVSAVRERFDGRVRAGAVIARRPDDAHLPMGSAVTLVVSKGPAPVPIPDVSGMAEDKAVAKLDADGFEVLVEQTFSARVDRGAAIGTDPRAGTEVQPGEQVVLTVSLGPERFPCPEFVGLSVVEARALAERYGLELAPLPVPGSNGDQVISQLPSAGTTVRYGSTVTVYHA